MIMKKYSRKFYIFGKLYWPFIVSYIEHILRPLNCLLIYKRKVYHNTIFMIFWSVLKFPINFKFQSNLMKLLTTRFQYKILYSIIKVGNRHIMDSVLSWSRIIDKSFILNQVHIKLNQADRDHNECTGGQTKLPKL